ncbi:MAG: EamA family transporter [Rhodospirillales bacterium]|jgi:drug/metabolite transporter (DMT)-like permease|nr:EamA family transporter [Rhodospirillales bacterium]MBT4039643.1 EamA family transporter [Rhodospirillales bacterium]MBT4625262.1 EamA family transporter [Rhodospirillales bacterium]MBT5352535.1 EamA family transporter [Rhodospirillales bacterium]MBT5519515.1 EamA family transporter [Rhodospirillales bacterium]
MDSVVLFAVLGAALLHATWNALLKSAGDRMVAMAFQDIVMFCISLFLIIFIAPTPDIQALPYIVMSVGVLVFYRVFLLKAYRYGDFGRSYPIARGSAPLLVAIAGIAIGDDVLPLHGYGAILLISIGIIGLIFSKRYAGDKKIDRGFLYALACGCMIASYSVIDSRGVRLADTAIGYYAYLSIVSCCWFPAYTVATRRRALIPMVRPLIGRALIAGNSSAFGYLIIIWAYSQSSAVQVVALRETSVIFGAVIGAYILKEGLGPRRITCSVLVAAGVIFLQLYQ